MQSCGRIAVSHRRRCWLHILAPLFPAAQPGMCLTAALAATQRLGNRGWQVVHGRDRHRIL